MSKTNSRPGYSLVEVLITLFIVAMALVLYQVAASSIRLTRTAKHQGVALRVANDKMEELRAGGYDAMPVSGSFADPELDVLAENSAEINITDFNSDTKQVLVQIQWREPGSATFRNLTLVTLVTKTGGL